jgi:hypothetical protein
MNKEFVTYEQALALKELGFDEPCFYRYNHSGTTPPDPKWDGKLRNNRKWEKFGDYDDCICSPLYQQAFRWFRENYDLHVQIRKENYFQQSAYEYFHFDISRGRETDITKQEDLLGDIFDECSQDIPGNHLNDEKYSKIVFERKFAFKTYEEIESYCLDKLIEIVKADGSNT